MKIVAFKSEILGRQFNPYLQAEVRPVFIDTEGEMRELLVQIDPLKVDPRKKPAETWETEIIHPIRYRYLAWLRQVADRPDEGLKVVSDNSARLREQFGARWDVLNLGYLMVRRWTNCRPGDWNALLALGEQYPKLLGGRA